MSSATSGPNSGGIDTNVGANVAISPSLPMPAWAWVTIASFGFRTGMPGCRAATASMQGPKAEQVNRMPSAPLDTA